MKKIPTRRRIPIITDLLEFKRMVAQPVTFCEDIVHRYGPVCYVPLPGVKNYMIHDPAILREIFITQASSFCKSRLYKAMRKVIGWGLLTNDGEDHLQQRRLVAPAFHRQRIAEYAKTMVECTLEETKNWKDGEEINMQQALAAITIRVITKTMFSSSLDEQQIHRVSQVVSELLEHTAQVFQNPWALICFEKGIQIPSVRRVYKLTKEVDDILYGIIERRRVDSAEHLDLLSMLMGARDEESGAVLDNKQIRDEVITTFMAGHETTATALSWCVYEIGRHPEYASKLRSEVDSVLQGRLPQAEDFPALEYCKKLFKETLRLYPPAWTLAREPLHDIEIEGYRFPKGSVLCTISTIMHHSEEYFSKPLEFIPDRWDDPALENLPRFVFFPFGGGSRMCIGEGFAWMEASMIIATIYSQWELKAMPGFTATTRPLFTLRVREDIFMTPLKRLVGAEVASV